MNSVLLRVDDQETSLGLSSMQTSLNWRHTRDRLTLEGEYFDQQVNGPNTSGSAAAVRAQYEWTNSLTGTLSVQAATNTVMIKTPKRMRPSLVGLIRFSKFSEVPRRSGSPAPGRERVVETDR